MRQFERWYSWLLLILLTAVALRLFQLADVPPGLTHDEADHGITALAILEEGTRELYFTVGHGREPLYDYATAVLMTFLGGHYLTGRVTAVFFSLVMLVGTYVWTNRAFNRNVALLTAAGLAVSFWPLVAARQALRSITLPALFVLAVYCFWRGLQKVAIGDWRLEIDGQPFLRSVLIWFGMGGVFLGITFYTYIPARGLWLLFPLVWVYLGWAKRPLAKRVWPGVLLMLGIAALIGLPLFAYLSAHPGAEIRIAELSRPLAAVTDGDFSLLWQNVKAGLGVLTFQGDAAWRYNLPGRPFLNPVMGLLFYAGLGVALWQTVRFRRDWRGAASFTALVWLVGGLAPVLITGPELSTTQAIGMQPVLTLFPALALAQGNEWLTNALPEKYKNTASLKRLPLRLRASALILLFGGTAVFTARDYFVTWANAPEVRVQYETTMVTALRYVAENDLENTAVSTITPGPFHTPALAQMILGEEMLPLRWFDARGSLLIPQAENGVVLTSGFASFHPALIPYFETAVRIETLPLRATDLDRPIEIYQVDSAAMLTAWQGQYESLPARFGETADFLGYDLQTGAVAPGETVRLASFWRVQQPVDGLQLFTHVSGADGMPLAQADGLDAPGYSWIPGDLLVQLHELMIPVETAVGHYPITIGLYTCLDAACEQTQRLPVTVNGSPAGDHLYLTNLPISP